MPLEQVLDFTEEVADDGTGCATGDSTSNRARETSCGEFSNIGIGEGGDLVDEGGFDGSFVGVGKRRDGASEIALNKFFKVTEV